MAEYLFSYGTMQKEKDQMQLFGRVLQGEKDILKGYKISPIEINDASFLAKGEQKQQSNGQIPIFKSGLKSLYARVTNRFAPCRAADIQGASCLRLHPGRGGGE